MIQLKERIGSPLQDTQQRHPIIGWQGRVGRIQGVAENMALVELAKHGGACTVEMLPGATCQSGFLHRSALSMKWLLVFDQKV